MANAASITSKIKRHLRGHDLVDVQVNTRSCASGTGPDRRWGWHTIVHPQADVTADQVAAALADFPRELTIRPSETGFVSAWQDDQC